MAYSKPPFDTIRYYIPPQNPDAYGLDVNYVTPSYTRNIPREDFDTFNQYHYDYLQNPITLPIPDDEVVPDYQVLEDESLNKFRNVVPDQTTVGNKSKFNFGNFNWQGVGNLATTATGHIMDVFNNAQSDLTIPKHTNYHTTTLNSLDDVYGLQQAQHLNREILHKPTANDFAFDYLRKTAEGAAAGSSFGPWGAVAGAAGGAGAAIANAFVKKNTYQNDLNKINAFNQGERRLRGYAYNRGLNNTIKNRNLSMNTQRLFNSYAQGGPVSNPEAAGVTTFNTGGTHESNPYGGIPQGVGDNGQTNLVEEGEVKWNDFIFSNRIQPSSDILSKYNTAFNKKFNSYADAANFILDLHKERENNPFDKSTLNVQMQRLADAQEYQKLSDEAAQYGLTPEEYIEYQQQAQQYANAGNTYPEGGQLYYDATKRQIVNTQPQHNYWVPIISGKSGKNYNGTYNFDSPFYSEFWNTLTPIDQATMKDQFKNWYFSESYQPTNIYGTNTPYNKWPNQNISVDDLYNEAINDKWGSVHQAWIDWMYSLMNHDNLTRQDVLTTPNRPTVQLRTVDVPDTTGQTSDNETATTTNPRYPWYYDALRAAPIWNNLRAILTQNNPDYTYANQIASTYRPVSSYPVGQYQRYQPVDQHYLDTQANQRANTQYGFYRDNTQSTSAANAYATLAAANQSAAINDAYTRALQTNNQNRNAALQYNNQLDRANEEARRATQAANYSNYANIMGNSYAAAEQERLAVENARETNMQNLAMNLGDLGRELYDRWRINNDPSLSYTTGWKYKQVIPLLNMWADMMNEYNKTTKSK